MDYITSDQLSKMQDHEHSLVLQMWNVLLQSNASETHCTLGAIKRFLFVIEGLTLDELNRDEQQSEIPDEVVKDLKRLFSEFKPLFTNRLAKQNTRKKSPRLEAGEVETNLTFSPVVSPRSIQILEQRTEHQITRKRPKIKDECTFQPNLVARQKKKREIPVVVLGLKGLKKKNFGSRNTSQTLGST